MKAGIRLILLGLLAGGTLALPVTGPVAARPVDDGRMLELPYQPGRIVTIHGHAQIQTMLRFADDERIENIAVGDSAGWQVTPNKRANRLFLKPIIAGAVTNMTVITDRREYLFELDGRKGRGAPVFAIGFLYPADAAPTDAVPPASMAVASALPPLPAMADAPQPTALNFAWEGSGKKNLLPSRVFDDGLSTYLKWDDKAQMPAVFARLPDGQQSPVNQIVSDGYVVIDHVPDELILQLGKDKARLVNVRPPQPVEQPMAGMNPGDMTVPEAQP